MGKKRKKHIRAVEVFSSSHWRAWWPDALKGAQEETATQRGRERQTQHWDVAWGYVHPFHSLPYKWVSFSEQNQFPSLSLTFYVFNKESPALIAGFNSNPSLKYIPLAYIRLSICIDCIHSALRCGVVLQKHLHTDLFSLPRCALLIEGTSPQGGTPNPLSWMSLIFLYVSVTARTHSDKAPGSYLVL